MRYNKEFVNGMKLAGSIAARVLKIVASHAVEGVTTNYLDQIALDVIKSNGVEPACLGYKGYPKTLCTSVNDVLCHGVPDDTPLKGGDIINIDVTVKLPKTGYHGDTSLTLYIPEHISATSEPREPILTDSLRNKIESLELIDAAREARDIGIKAIRPFGHTGDIGFVTSTFLKKYNGRINAVYSIGGHGIGKKFHQDPFVPAVGYWGTGETLLPWTCITVEPILVSGNPAFSTEQIKGSSITVHKTLSGKNACQFEHTVLITDTGYEILTEA